MPKKFTIRETVGIISTAYIEPSQFDYKFNIFLPVYKDVKIIDLMVFNFINLKCKTIVFICSPEQFLFLKKRYKDCMVYKDNFYKQESICKFYYIINNYKNNLYGMVKCADKYYSDLQKVFDVNKKIYFFFSNNHSIINPNLFIKNNFKLDYMNFLYRKKETFEQRKIIRKSLCFNLPNNEFFCVPEFSLSILCKSLKKDDKNISYKDLSDQYINDKTIFDFNLYDKNPVFNLLTWNDYVSLINFINNNKALSNFLEFFDKIHKTFYLPQVSYDNFQFQDEFDIITVISKKYDNNLETKYEQWKDGYKRLIKTLN